MVVSHVVRVRAEFGAPEGFSLRVCASGVSDSLAGIHSLGFNMYVCFI